MINTIAIWKAPEDDREMKCPLKPLEEVWGFCFIFDTDTAELSNAAVTGFDEALAMVQGERRRERRRETKRYDIEDTLWTQTENTQREHRDNGIHLWFVVAHNDL